MSHIRRFNPTTTVIYNNTSECSSFINLDKYTQLTNSYKYGAYMVLDNNPNKILRLGKIADLKGGLGYLPCDAADCTTRVLLIDYLPSNSSSDPMNLSLVPINNLTDQFDNLDINKKLDILVDDD